MNQEKEIPLPSYLLPLKHHARKHSRKPLIDEKEHRPTDAEIATDEDTADTAILNREHHRENKHRHVNDLARSDPGGIDPVKSVKA